MALKVNSAETRPGVFTVSPIGSLDGNTYQILETTVDAALKEMPNVIIFDLEFLDYINSMGVRVLLKTKKELEKNNGKIIFAHLQPQIRFGALQHQIAECKDVVRFAVIALGPDRPAIGSENQRQTVASTPA